MRRQAQTKRKWMGEREWLNCAVGSAGGGGNRSVEAPAEGTAVADTWAVSVDARATVVVFAGLHTCILLSEPGSRGRRHRARDGGRRGWLVDAVTG